MQDAATITVAPDETLSVEILTSAATHGYLPLLYEDASIRAQVRAGMATSEPSRSSGRLKAASRKASRLWRSEA